MMEKKAAVMLEAYAIGASSALQELGMDKVAADEIAIKLAEEPSTGERILNQIPSGGLMTAALSPRGSGMEGFGRGLIYPAVGAVGGGVAGSAGGAGIGAGVGALAALLSRGKLSPGKAAIEGAAMGGAGGGVLGFAGGGMYGRDKALRDTFENAR